MLTQYSNITDLRVITFVNVWDPKCALLLCVPQIWFNEWPGEDSESQHIATCIIDRI